MSEVEVSPESVRNGQPDAATVQLSVADVVGQTIAAQGVKDAFGVIGSGNLVVTNALCRHGARFHHARHEMSATCMTTATPA